MQDVVRFVVASLDLPRWEPDSRIVGDKLCYNELVQLVKKVTGRELKITRVPLDEINRALDGELKFGERFYYQLLLVITQNRMDFESTSSIRLPEIKPMLAEEYLRKFWRSD
jgi:hypothetical protein